MSLDVVSGVDKVLNSHQLYERITDNYCKSIIDDYWKYSRSNNYICRVALAFVLCVFGILPGIAYIYNLIKEDNRQISCIINNVSTQFQGSKTLDDSVFKNYECVFEILRREGLHKELAVPRDKLREAFAFKWEVSHPADGKSPAEHRGQYQKDYNYLRSQGVRGVPAVYEKYPELHLINDEKSIKCLDENSFKAYSTIYNNSFPLLGYLNIQELPSPVEKLQVDLLAKWINSNETDLSNNKDLLAAVAFATEQQLDFIDILTKAKVSELAGVTISNLSDFRHYQAIYKSLKDLGADVLEFATFSGLAQAA